LPSKGVAPLFKGCSPHLRPQPLRAESFPIRSKILPPRRGGWVPRVMQAGPEQKKPNRRAWCVQSPGGYKHFTTFAQTSGRKGGQPCRRHATAPSGRTSPTSNTPSLEDQTHASCNRCVGCYMTATAPPPAPPPRLLDCGTNTATRGDPARDPAAPAWRDGQCGRRRASSNGGGRRVGAAVTSSAKLTSHAGAVREPSLTA
jgi:general stress protein YciG